MSEQFEYTTLANRYTAKFPMLTYVGTQVNFWIVANVLLVTLVHFLAQAIGQAFALPVGGSLGGMMLAATALGLLYGVGLGVGGYYLERNLFRKLPLGKVILFKTVSSLVLLIILLVFVRFMLFDQWIVPSFQMQDMRTNEKFWSYLFYFLLAYYAFMTLVISFVNQVNKKFGPGVLIPLLAGRYRNPREEDKIFMFMDLKSSTAIAEELGHLKYSALIRDCFADINEVLFPFRVQVYQYVGDEVVVTWPAQEGLTKHHCIRFFFGCKRQFSNRDQYYISNYGLRPEFKAGAHIGKVTAVEIGEVKRDIAYHGDTLNTASRIQSVCNEYQKDLLISESLLEKMEQDDRMKIEKLGMIRLKGKSKEIGIVSIQWKEENFK